MITEQALKKLREAGRHDRSNISLTESYNRKDYSDKKTAVSRSHIARALYEIAKEASALRPEERDRLYSAIAREFGLVHSGVELLLKEAANNDFGTLTDSWSDVLGQLGR